MLLDTVLSEHQIKGDTKRLRVVKCQVDLYTDHIEQIETFSKTELVELLVLVENKTLHYQCLLLDCYVHKYQTCSIWNYWWMTNIDNAMPYYQDNKVAIQVWVC